MSQDILQLLIAHIYIIIAVLSGFTIVTSRSVKSILAEKIGMYQSTFFNYVLGLTGSLVLLFISGETLRLFSIQPYDATWFYYTGGLLVVIGLAYNLFIDNKALDNINN